MVVLPSTQTDNCLQQQRLDSGTSRPEEGAEAVGDDSESDGEDGSNGAVLGYYV